MPKAYWFGARMTVKDPDKLKAYAELAGQAVSEYGGRYLARGAETKAFEGPAQARAVIIEFKDMDTAIACHGSTIYQNALKKLDGSVDRDLFVIEGIE